MSQKYKSLPKARGSVLPISISNHAIITEKALCMAMFLLAMRDLGLAKFFKEFEEYAPSKTKGTPSKADIQSALDYVRYEEDDGINLNTFCEVFGLSYSATRTQILLLIRTDGPKYVLKHLGDDNEFKS